MAAKNNKQDQLEAPIQVRFTKEVKDDLRKIATANGIELCDAIRMAARFGAPILKERLADSVKKAA